MVALKSKAKFSYKNARKEPTKKLNPFEVHINKVKHKVLGQKLKSDQGLPGISRNKALQKRKKTLLQEYNMKNKTNQFIDQRIGERNSEMTEDDRIMARFAAERKRTFNKKTMFNLSDSVVLTHRGQTLSEIERFEDNRSDDEEEPGESGALRGKFVSSAHFGGGMLTKNKQDRESIIDELINESKKRKAERQHNKEETLEATQQLDEDWKTLGQIVTPKTTDSTNKPSKDLVDTQKKDAYDIIMRQFKFEPHGQASQRLKTDEEIVKEDKEQLERLEKERLKQLREIEAAKQGNHRSADDIDDDEPTYEVYDIKEDKNDEAEESESSSGSDVEMDDEEEENDSSCEEDNALDLKPSKSEKNKLKRVISNEVESKTEGEGKERKRTPSEKVKLVDEVEDIMKNEEETVDLTEELIIDEGHMYPADSVVVSSDDDDEYAMNDLTDLMPSLNENSERNEIKTDNISTEIKHSSSNENSCKPETVIQLDLPYVLHVPESYKSFKDLLEKYSVEQQNVIFERLVKSNHPSLEPGNKKKMLNLAEYMNQFVSEGKVTWKALPVLALHFSILKEFNKDECLKILVDNILTKLEDFNITSTSGPNVKFLAWYVLLLMKPQGMEVLLPVTKPALSLACKILSQADPLSTHHVTTALLCCYLLLQEAKNSFTVYTDAITFLQNCVKMKTKNISDKVSHNSLETKRMPQLTSQHLPVSTATNFKLRLADQEDEVLAEDSHVLYCSVILLSGFVKVYRKYPQSKIMFQSVHHHFSQIKVDAYQQSLKQEIVELQTVLQVLHSAKLPPLVKAAQKPKALRLYEPSFYTVTVGKSNRGLPAEQVEEQKLLHKYKHEMKGAMRELRRDRVFLANVKLSEQTNSDDARKRKVKEIFGSAAAQQGELRKLKRKK